MTNRYSQTFIAALFILATPLAMADTYSPPSLQHKSLNSVKKSYHIKKEEGYQDFKVNRYKVNEKPIRQRDLASEKKADGRLPSSHDDLHKHHAKEWIMNPKSL